MVILFPRRWFPGFARHSPYWSETEYGREKLGHGGQSRATGPAPRPWCRRRHCVSGSKPGHARSGRLGRNLIGTKGDFVRNGNLFTVTAAVPTGR